MRRRPAAVSGTGFSPVVPASTIDSGARVSGAPAVAVDPVAGAALSQLVVSSSASESEIQQAILHALGSRADVRLWRQNVIAARRRNADGSRGRLVRSTLRGSPDLTGWLTLPCGLAVRLDVEVKRPAAHGRAAGRLSPEQLAYQHTATAMGVCHVVARSVDEALAAVESFLVAADARLRAHFTGALR